MRGSLASIGSGATPARGAERGMVRWVLAMLSARRSRQELARLDDDLLRDAGLTRDQAAREIARPFWDVPRNWRC